MKQVAIIGGGPAGALAGAELARGCRVTVFDEKLAWEKPCGGGLTQKALARYPFLKDNAKPKKLVRRVVLSTSRGSVGVVPRDPVCIYSRYDLNGLLLERAANAGCELVRDRITSIERCAAGWRLRGRNGNYAAGFLVLASGARNPFRQMGAALRSSDVGATAGYYVPGTQDALEIQFLENFEGYIWVFPRADHLSVGIYGKPAAEPVARMRERLHRTMDERGLRRTGAGFYSHILPSPGPGAFAASALAGDGWAVVGDAAALVDPITGEGIYYALRSAELLATCCLEERIAEYPRRLRRDFGFELEKAASISHRFYAGKFFGGSIPARMVQMARHSAVLRNIIADLFAGSQGYTTLRQRLRGSLPSVVGELFWKGGEREAA